MSIKPLPKISVALALAGLSLCLLPGCVGALSKPAQAQKEASRGEVRGCRLLGHYKGGAGGGIAIGAKYGRENAKNQVLEQAAQAGATHVVWTGGDNDYWGPSAQAKAYRCP